MTMSENNMTPHAFRVAWMLGWQDVLQAYRRSVIGPFWLTISMALIVGTMGFVFSLIFGMDIREYLPYIAGGIVLWGFISNTIVEGCNAFIAGEAMIKQLNLPLFTHVLRVVVKNVFVLLHNVIIIPAVFVIVGYPLSFTALMSVAGLIVVLANLVWVVYLVGFISARFRDLPTIVASLMSMVFYLTPVMWLSASIPEGDGKFVLGLNPFAHLLSLLRDPLLGQIPPLESWLVGIGLAIGGTALSLFVVNSRRARLPYWV